jgi:hypothetical protein
LIVSPGCAGPVSAPPGASADAAVLPVEVSVAVLYTVDTGVVAALAADGCQRAATARHPHATPPTHPTQSHRTSTPVPLTHCPEYPHQK